jgi:hypothetical protein
VEPVSASTEKCVAGGPTPNNPGGTWTRDGEG